MAKMQNTPHPQKSPAKAKAAVNKMKGAATTAPRSPNESNEPDVPDEPEVKVGIESVVWDHPEADKRLNQMKFP
jgi:soluble cytochrome b562